MSTYLSLRTTPSIQAPNRITQLKSEGMHSIKEATLIFQHQRDIENLFKKRYWLAENKLGICIAHLRVDYVNILLIT